MSNGSASLSVGFFACDDNRMGWTTITLAGKPADWVCAGASRRPQTAVFRHGYDGSTPETTRPTPPNLSGSRSGFCVRTPAVLVE
jgi:hypothetical protein